MVLTAPPTPTSCPAARAPRELFNNRFHARRQRSPPGQRRRRRLPLSLSVFFSLLCIRLSLVTFVPQQKFDITKRNSSTRSSSSSSSSVTLSEGRRSRRPTLRDPVPPCSRGAGTRRAFFGASDDLIFNTERSAPAPPLHSPHPTSHARGVRGGVGGFF